MGRPVKLSNYDDWKHCITIECGIPLTPEFIENRIASLRDPNDLHTRKFTDEWGQEHLNRVIRWFERARTET